MSESTQEGAVAQKTSLSKQITTAMTKDGKFTLYDEISYEIRKESYSINKFDFYNKVYRYTDSNECIKLSFILACVHELGHATKNMIRSWLAWEHKIYPDKLIPNFTEDETGDKILASNLYNLCKNGLLISHDFVTWDKHVVVVYTCTSYGHIFYRNKLDVFSSYDVNAMFRTDIGVFRRLVVNSVALPFQKSKHCTGIFLNGRYGLGKYECKEGHVYAVVELDGGGENGQILVIEPIFTSFNKKTTTMEEQEKKNIDRIDQIKKIVNELKTVHNTCVRVVYVLENMKGLRFIKTLVAQNFGLPCFENALYTSENVFYCNKENLDACFMKADWKDDNSRIAITPARNTWSTLPN